MVCKGFMKPDDLCIVDMEGKQLAGQRKRTSEIMLHLAIMKERPEVKSVVHCHPPHATAFGIAREPVPQCVLPEVEIFLGDVPITKYAIPGGKEFAETILPFVQKSNVIILANHGTVSYGETVEKAYWWTEVLDAYCRMLMLARGLGRINYFSEPEAQALLDLKGKWGIQRPPHGDEELRTLRQQRLPRELAAIRRPSRGLRAAQASGGAGFVQRPGCVSSRQRLVRPSGLRRTGSPDPGDYRARGRGVEPAAKQITLLDFSAGRDED